MIVVQKREMKFLLTTAIDVALLDSDVSSTSMLACINFSVDLIPLRRWKQELLEQNSSDFLA